MKKRYFRISAGIFSAGVGALLSLTLYIQSTLPDHFNVTQGEELLLNSRLGISSSPAVSGFSAPVSSVAGDRFSLELKLFETVPLKQVQVQVVPRRMVVPGGFAFGIKMFTEGVMVVGLSDIQTGSENKNPAKDAGVKVGDIILAVNNNEVSRNEDVASRIAQSGGEEVTLSVERDGEAFSLRLTPIISPYDNAYKAGIWVRDSSAGIGTMTYYDPDTLMFGGLGHAICDVDTGKIMPLGNGEIVDVVVTGANPGQSGKPGELQGSFVGDTPIGSLFRNSEVGIFGRLDPPYFGGEAIPMGLKQEVKPGPASIYSTISGNTPQRFDVLIEKVNYSGVNPTKNMVIRVVDPALLSETGGIVQGMSGSPIIQEGKLMGAVTHVFVNDPTMGYGIFAENMDQQLQFVEKMKNIA